METVRYTASDIPFGTTGCPPLPAAPFLGPHARLGGCDGYCHQAWRVRLGPGWRLMRPLGTRFHRLHTAGGQTGQKGAEMAGRMVGRSDGRRKTRENTSKRAEPNGRDETLGKGTKMTRDWGAREMAGQTAPHGPGLHSPAECRTPLPTWGPRGTERTHQVPGKHVWGLGCGLFRFVG